MENTNVTAVPSHKAARRLPKTVKIIDTALTCFVVVLVVSEGVKWYNKKDDSANLTVAA